jgi:hypothetical protein
MLGKNVMKLNFEKRSRPPRFIWADKAALLVACAFLSLLAFCWSLVFLAVGSLGARHLWGYLGIRGFELCLLVAGSAWFVMRSADLMTGGSTYRLFAQCAENLNCIAAKFLAHHREGNASVP